MSDPYRQKNLSNPFSTGGGGTHFEAHIQASFVLLMLTGGFAPGTACWPVVRIKLQGKSEGYETDDAIIFVQGKRAEQAQKLLCQIKHTIAFTRKDTTLAEVLAAAWRDYNNPRLFEKGRDRIALITGPLNATDHRAVGWLLDQARVRDGAEDFFKTVKKKKVSPSKAIEKLSAIRFHLDRANYPRPVSDYDLYQFLRHFYLLGYDLGGDLGVVISLLRSHIAQFEHPEPQNLWSRVVDIVQAFNQAGGTVTRENLPDDLLDAFRKRTTVPFPSELARSRPGLPEIPQEYATSLAVANLLGSWSENHEADLLAIHSLASSDYKTWIQPLRALAVQAEGLIVVRDGVWRVRARKKLWGELGTRLFDDHLDAIGQLALEVLGEFDPGLELPKEERYAAGVRGKVPRFSEALKEGVAACVALLGQQPAALTRCTHGKAEATTAEVVRKLLDEFDWARWASLDAFLPALAEAAPTVFLSILERALGRTPALFDELFRQEGTTILGRSYTTGLLWALETLAWDPILFPRTVLILGELANRDPGGTYANRAENSLTMIFLPWRAQTLAPFNKREAALRALRNELPDVAWTLLRSLLPNQHQISTDTNQPKWGAPLPDWDKPITYQEFHDQTDALSNLAVEMAVEHPKRLVELTADFDHLSGVASNRLLEFLGSKSVVELPDAERCPIWEQLTELIHRHRRCPEADWSLGAKTLNDLEAVAKRLAPADPGHLYRHLFGHGPWLDLELENWEEELSARRQRAVEAILRHSDMAGLLEFAVSVEDARGVGTALAANAGLQVEQELIPDLLMTDDTKLSGLLDGYIRRRLFDQGWAWVDALARESWALGQTAAFLSHLPFGQPTWKRVEKWLGDSEGMYWSKTRAPSPGQGNLELGIDKLLEFGRPLDALDCLDRMRYEKQPLNWKQCIRALRESGSSPQLRSWHEHLVVALLATLQADPSVPEADLEELEWTYLSWLGRHAQGAPKTLHRRLSRDPEFFCGLLTLLYRPEGEEAKADSETSRRKARLVWRLFTDWQLPPGRSGDEFDEALFKDWLERAEQRAGETGHLRAAAEHTGQVLVHCPADPSGLWIPHAVAEALNRGDAEYMRLGFEIGCRNLRGAHYIDPAGQPELDLAVGYEEKAEQLEEHGFIRFATSVRRVAEAYRGDAARIRHDEGEL
ncbi:MAG: hypothetical protein AB7S38_40245 [Vulcanimicrobiota bacterium]